MTGRAPFELLLPPGCAVSGNADDPLTRREHSEPPHNYRSPFERDRSRIIHARAFRRLAGKTQVFTHRYSDHFRSRLTHTMEVAQIARTIASAVGLNEDLTEALALVHDIGHPPFGHAGERALDAAMRNHGLSFDHNLHALRIVEHFEQRYAAFRGINLTLGVREGIIKHSRDYSATDHPELSAYSLNQRPPLEAQLIDLADEIAYLTADIDDGMEAEVLALPDVRRGVSLFERCYGPMGAAFPGSPAKLVFNEGLKRMLNALVDDLITETGMRVRGSGVDTLKAVRRFPERLVAFSPEMEAMRRDAKQFLYDALYSCEELTRDHNEAEQVITELFEAWCANPMLLPPGYSSRVEEEGAPRVVADYLAGMTDNFILAQHAEWKSLR